MPNDTPLGWIQYPDENDTDWYSGSAGLEEWLARIELLGLPTYSSESDLPDPTETGTIDPENGTQHRQFAAVLDEQVVYRVNDDGEWEEWLGGVDTTESLSWSGDQTFETGARNPEETGDDITIPEGETAVFGGSLSGEGSISGDGRVRVV